MHPTPATPVPPTLPGAAAAQLLDSIGTAADTVHGAWQELIYVPPILLDELRPNFDELQRLLDELDQLARQLAGIITLDDSGDWTTKCAVGDQLDDTATYLYRAGRHLVSARTLVDQLEAPAGVTR